MPCRIDVSFLPEHLGDRSLNGSIAVVIDVLRASTTIVTALKHGAECVIPFASSGEALQYRENLENKKRVLLGGERRGVLIDGFDLDNSPLSYKPESIADNTILFTTSNGTKALLRSETADEIVVGSFLNLSAVVRYLLGRKKNVQFVCAGTDGEITAEDVLCAGAMVEKLENSASYELDFSDAAKIAKNLYCQKPQKDLFQTLKESQGGQNLLELGFADDIEFAAKIDLFDLVPRYSLRTGRIEPITTKR